MIVFFFLSRLWFNIYYRLHENVRSHSKSTPPGGIGRSDTEDNLPGPVSRSSSITSLNTRKHVTGIPVPSSGVVEESANQVCIDFIPWLQPVTHHSEIKYINSSFLCCLLFYMKVQRDKVSDKKTSTKIKFFCKWVQK